MPEPPRFPGAFDYVQILAAKEISMTRRSFLFLKPASLLTAAWLVSRVPRGCAGAPLKNEFDERGHSSLGTKTSCEMTPPVSSASIRAIPWAFARAASVRMVVCVGQESRRPADRLSASRRFQRRSPPERRRRPVGQRQGRQRRQHPSRLRGEAARLRYHVPMESQGVGRARQPCRV